MEKSKIEQVKEQYESDIKKLEFQAEQDAAELHQQINRLKQQLAEKDRENQACAEQLRDQQTE